MQKRDVLSGEKHKKLAGHFDLPVFVSLWVWAAARSITSGGQPDALLATHMQAGACHVRLL